MPKSEWSPESENVPYTYEQALADAQTAAQDALRLAADMGFMNDRFVTALFVELLIAKQETQAS